jgi:hypothetical protein
MSQAMKAIGSVMARPDRLVSRPRDLPPAQQELIDVNNGKTDQPPLLLTPEELGELGYVRMANRDDVLVWVSPLGFRNGVPFYPPIDLEPGDKRRAREAAMNVDYDQYRKAKSAQPTANRQPIPGFDDD